MWAGHFDEFRNMDFDPLSKVDSQGHLYRPARALDKLWHLGLLREQCPPPQTADKAFDWFEMQDGPRFLWLHLMTPHSPYYPGLRRAVNCGLISSYKSSLSWLTQDLPGRNAPNSYRETIVELYWQCCDLLDSHMETILDRITDDATVIITGDHGEELLDRDFIGHRRLYDDATRVPLITNLDDVPSQQKDLPASIAQEIGIDVPDSWMNDDSEYTFASHHHKPQQKIHTSIRTSTRKLIFSYSDEDEKLVTTEYYNIENDPGEKNDLSAEVIPQEEIMEKLREYSEDVISAHLGRTADSSSSKVVNDRLQDLGYV